MKENSTICLLTTKTSAYNILGTTTVSRVFSSKDTAYDYRNNANCRGEIRRVFGRWRKGSTLPHSVPRLQLDDWRHTFDAKGKRVETEHSIALRLEEEATA